MRRALLSPMACALKMKQASLDSFLRQNPPKSLNPNPSIPNSPSDYERLRLDTIRRNLDFLQNLGIASASPSLKPRITKRATKHSPIPSIPLRRSSRKRGRPPLYSDDANEVDNPSLPSDVEVIDSSVFQYACDGANDSFSGSSSSIPTSSASPISGFKLADRAFRDPSLSKIYSLDAFFIGQGRFLIAAGGHGGFISVYGGGGISVEGDDDQWPLMSWKGSRSWVSGVMFVERNPMLLISSSNDGKITVWDIKKQQSLSSPSSSSSSRWIPPVLTESKGLHSSGIFSMDRFDCLVATASKDSSLGISRISSSGELVAERTLSGHHSGAIRGVCFGDEKDYLADCGADGRICILDTRLKEPCTVSINSHHSTGINTIEWCKMNKPLLLTASRDPELLLYDIRSHAEPLYKLSGHVEPMTRTNCKIYRPAFIDGGTAVATAGQGSGKISLYSVENGTLLSQGMIGYDANLVKTFVGDTVVDRIWTAGRQINQLLSLRSIKCGRASALGSEASPSLCLLFR